MNVKEVIDKLEQNFKNQKEQVELQFKPLKHAQLNWRPDEKKWSIIECIEHLNLVGRYYYKNSRLAVDTARKKNLLAKEAYTPGWIGNYSERIMRPTEENKVKFKMKTFSPILPEPSNINVPITIDEFTDRQDEFLKLFKDARAIDIGGVKVKTLAGNLLKFKLGDALRFIDAHQERHLLQASNVKNHPNFPST
jgi:hypothetical protein